jgi:hypothetical protein
MSPWARSWSNTSYGSRAPGEYRRPTGCSRGHQKNSSAAKSPEKSARAQSRCAAFPRASGYFPRCLDPVLEGGEENEDAVIASEVPGGHPVRQATLRHQAHPQADNPVCVEVAGLGQVRHVGAKRRSYLGAYDGVWSKSRTVGVAGRGAGCQPDAGRGVSGCGVGTAGRRVDRDASDSCVSGAPVVVSAGPQHE